MEILGKIVEILGEKHVLLQLSKKVAVNTVLTVYSDLQIPELQKKYELESIHLPKGEIRIISQQGIGLYLAESFRETFNRPMLPNAAGLLSGFLAQQTVQGPPSARFSEATVHVNLEIDKTIYVGDVVGIA
jgi:hypothetical protein